MELSNIGSRFEEASNLIRDAFATNKESALDYTTEFISSCYRYPGADPALSPAFFDNGSMVSVLASFPRRVRFDNREALLALLTFNSVSPEYRRFGLGIEMVSEAVERAKQAGYNGAIFYCVDGNIANKTTVVGFRAAGATCRKVFTLDYLMGLPRPSPPPASICEPDTNTFVRLANQMSMRLPFARIWSEEEARWECSEKSGAVTQALEFGSAKGIISGYVLNDSHGTPCAQIENVLWDELDADQRVTLLKLFLSNLGIAKIAVMPLWNYIDDEIFRKVGFRRSPRRLNVYVCFWDGKTVLDSLDAMYIDVL
jgi:GNAT superfamily N-acetyltransferase